MRALYVSLHTSQPGAEGAHEATFAGYSRAYAHAWVQYGDHWTNSEELAFPECAGGNEKITHCAFRADAAGPSRVVEATPLVMPLWVNKGVTVRFYPSSIYLPEGEP